MCVCVFWLLISHNHKITMIENIIFKLRAGNKTKQNLTKSKIMFMYCISDRNNRLHFKTSSHKSVSLEDWCTARLKFYGNTWQFPSGSSFYWRWATMNYLHVLQEIGKLEPPETTGVRKCRRLYQYLVSKKEITGLQCIPRHFYTTRNENADALTKKATLITETTNTENILSTPQTEGLWIWQYDMTIS